MAERIVRRGRVELATQDFGDTTDPALLLIMGMGASMLWWPQEFCERLAAGGLHVIRYDNRDTGLSTTWPPGNPGYSFGDMADDAVAILDGYGIRAAHVAGMSMGGGIAQRVALRHPERVETLTAISTSPYGIEGLPAMSAVYLDHAAGGEEIDWNDRAGVVAFVSRDAAMLAGTAHPHDAAAMRQTIERDFDRAQNYASTTNHALVGGDESVLTAADLSMPLLVIHGTMDPIFSIEHGEAFLSLVPSAALVRIEGGGHELHRLDWPQIVGAMIEHTAGRQTGTD